MNCDVINVTPPLLNVNAAADFVLTFRWIFLPEILPRYTTDC